MARFTLSLTLVLVSVMLVTGLPVSADEPAELKLEKPCVIVGRILGADVHLFPTDQTPGTEQTFKDMTRIKGFEILNVKSGEWHPISLSKDGYFCANVRMGEYDLRGRDCEGRPYLILRFNVPLDMAVNLGTFRIETCNPTHVAMEQLHDYRRTDSWRVFREGEGQIALRLKRDTTREAYEDCEKWFAGCYKEAYKRFEKVIARR